VAAVETEGVVLEAAFRGARVAGQIVDTYVQAWRMEKGAGPPEGEIWFGEARKAEGCGAGVRWWDPCGITDGQVCYLELFGAWLQLDTAQGWPGLLGEEGIVVAGAVGVRW
jgi:hypothetical protein